MKLVQQVWNISFIIPFTWCWQWRARWGGEDCHRELRTINNDAEPLGEKEEHIKTSVNVKSPHYEFCLQTSLIIQRRHFHRFHPFSVSITEFSLELLTLWVGWHFHKFASNTNDMFSALFTFPSKATSKYYWENYAILLFLSTELSFRLAVGIVYSVLKHMQFLLRNERRFLHTYLLLHWNFKLPAGLHAFLCLTVFYAIIICLHRQI